MADDVIHLYADGLLSKWGFGDGDMLNDLLFDWMYPDGWNKTRHVDERKILAALVRTRLLPALAAAGHEVEVYEMDTNHNPIRAQKVDGVDNADFSSWEQAPVEWRVTEVTVPVSEVLTLADEMGRALVRPH